MKKFSLNGIAGLALAGAVLGASALGAAAQESTNRVAAEVDWSVFVDGSPQECWLVSAPKKTVNTKDGKPVQVRRGDIRLFVTYRQGKPGEVSFAGGYPFASGSTVDLEVGGNTFKLFTDGEGAWAHPAQLLEPRAMVIHDPALQFAHRQHEIFVRLANVAHDH